MAHQSQDKALTWCIDTGVQESVMPGSVYKESYGPMSKPDRKLVRADVPLMTVVVDDPFVS